MERKRIFALILSAVIAVSVVSCSKDTADSSTDSAETGGNTAASAYDFSKNIDENGFFTGIRALDYVTLGKYSGIEIPADKCAVTDDEIRSAISSIVSDHRTKNDSSDRVIKDGDTVNIDYVGSVDGVAFDGGNTQGKGTDVTIGVTSYIDDFLEQLIGHVPGDTFDVEVTFPDPYPNNSDLAGKDAVFKTTVNYVMDSPELTDDFVAAELSEDYGWKTLDEMNESIKSDLATNKIATYVRSSLTEIATVSSVPESVFENQKNVMFAIYSSMSAQYGMTLDDMIKAQGFDSLDAFVESEKDNLKAEGEKVLIYQAIAEDLGITVTEKDAEESLAESLGSGVTAAMIENYKQSFGMPYLMQTAMIDAVTDYMCENAVQQK